MGRRGRGATRRFSLRSHLLLLVVGTVLPFLVLCGVLLQRLLNENRAAAERRLIEAARSEASLVDFEMADTLHALEALGASPFLDSGDLYSFYLETQRVQRTQAAWYTVVLLRPDGQQLVNARRPWGEQLPRSTEYAAIEEITRTYSPQVGNLARGIFEGQLAFPVRSPVIRDGEVRYVLSAVITPDRLTDLLRRQQTPSDEWARAVVDAGGTVVSRTRDPERFIGQRVTQRFLDRRAAAPEGIYQDISLDGGLVYSAFTRAPLSGWTTTVAVPVSTVEGPLRRSMIALGGLGVLMVGFGGAGAFLISRRIAHSIRSAAAAANALAVGERPIIERSDVAEVDRLVSALERSSALLEARQRERDEQVARADAARADAEAADRAKDDFLAMLGHELRNPLAPVLTALQLMTMRGVTAAQRERAVIERQVKHLTRLVDDLLDVSRLRRGKVELRYRRFELSAAVAKAVDIAEPLMADRGHRLTVDVPATGMPIDGDETRIAQVLANLLTNAAKYSDHPGHISLRARLDGPFIEVECVDDGAGIAADVLPRIFDLFAQGARTIDRRDGGLGLGLAVARTLTELHGGTIEAHSGGPGRGSRFVVRVPLAAGAVVERRAEVVVPPIVAEEARRVLVVDDNVDAREMLAEALAAAGLDVRTAPDGPSALSVAEHFQPDVGVLDIGLPGMSGFELARQFRARGDARSLRLIAVTGYGQANDVAEARAAGFDAHLVKPVSTDALVNLIRAPLITRRTA